MSINAMERSNAEARSIVGFRFISARARIAAATLATGLLVFAMVLMQVTPAGTAFVKPPSAQHAEAYHMPEKPELMADALERVWSDVQASGPGTSNRPITLRAPGGPADSALADTTVDSDAGIGSSPTNAIEGESVLNTTPTPVSNNTREPDARADSHLLDAMRSIADAMTRPANGDDQPEPSSTPNAAIEPEKLSQ